MSQEGTRAQEPGGRHKGASNARTNPNQKEDNGWWPVISDPCATKEGHSPESLFWEDMWRGTLKEFSLSRAVLCQVCSWVLAHKVVQFPRKHCGPDKALWSASPPTPSHFTKLVRLSSFCFYTLLRNEEYNAFKRPRKVLDKSHLKETISSTKNHLSVRVTRY